jgi:hypothetical protein
MSEAMIEIFARCNDKAALAFVFADRTGASKVLTATHEIYVQVMRHLGEKHFPAKPLKAYALRHLAFSIKTSRWFEAVERITRLQAIPLD